MPTMVSYLAISGGPISPKTYSSSWKNLNVTWPAQTLMAIVSSLPRLGITPSTLNLGRLLQLQVFSGAELQVFNLFFTQHFFLFKMSHLWTNYFHNSNYNVWNLGNASFTEKPSSLDFNTQEKPSTCRTTFHMQVMSAMLWGVCFINTNCNGCRFFPNLRVCE